MGRAGSTVVKQMTLRDQIVRGLERLGYERDAWYRQRTTRYVVFIDHEHDRRIFVGLAGAVRVGMYIAASIPSNGLKARALAAGLPERWAA
jgi:pantothenate kinase